jgi:hypothetical protein
MPWPLRHGAFFPVSAYRDRLAIRGDADERDGQSDGRQRASVARWTFSRANSRPSRRNCVGFMEERFSSDNELKTLSFRRRAASVHVEGEAFLPRNLFVACGRSKFCR